MSGTHNGRCSDPAAAAKLAALFAPPPPKEPTDADRAVDTIRRLERQVEVLGRGLATCFVNLSRWADGQPETVERGLLAELAAFAKRDLDEARTLKGGQG